MALIGLLSLAACIIFIVMLVIASVKKKPKKVAGIGAAASFVVFVICLAATPSADKQTPESETAMVEAAGTPAPEKTPGVSTESLPIINKDDYIGKVGLEVFNALNEKGYQVNADFDNDFLTSANGNAGELFSNTSMDDLESVDAFAVSDLFQDGDSVNLVIKLEPKNYESESGLPKVAIEEYIGKESLLVYHDLKEKGYIVEAKYTTELGEALTNANQNIIDAFDTLDPENEEDRLSVDAYIVKDIIQDGDMVELIIN